MNIEIGRIRAVGLLSGGLDSTLAAKIMLEQGIEVYAINFTSPFCTCTPKSAGCAAAITAVRELGGIPLRRVALKDEYLEIVKNPRFGYGSGMNPCIDCRIEKIKRAGEYMKEIGAAFIFTGEVLGQRPMSQHRQALRLIDEASGLGGYILRPLSAQYLEPTIPEQEGIVDRQRLFAIRGRSRKSQMELAREKGIVDYPCPAGGCLLTDKNFADRMRDYFKYTEKPSIKDIPLLKVGRHFRLESGDKFIVARNQAECRTLRNLHRDEDHMLVPQDFPGPVVILQGHDIEAAARKLLHYTKRLPERKVHIACFHRGRKDLFTVRSGGFSGELLEDQGLGRQAGIKS
ncbi:MAG: hypothetical protein JRJ29_03445 [Deltaproteobacteria bacterium]|nr:hypothetical protein [Deltaproteobacteria bacterium]